MDKKGSNKDVKVNYKKKSVAKKNVSSAKNGSSASEINEQSPDKGDEVDGKMLEEKLKQCYMLQRSIISKSKASEVTKQFGKQTDSHSRFKSLTVQCHIIR
ncbi:uncharacterized protein LOC130715340 isoform X2 [Lotus japonicus]|uniref:uncharacterized protein LOC130715340 isoform X2 n=1 Tax=Lotus japonicus TaxID=34305 RepID=UPI002583A48E|nr:uncharacterized protein LOC130715340 isoform X2 [Lotus japonicus]